LFGQQNTQQPSGGLFGQQQNNQPQSGSLFGSKPAAPGAGLFGNTNNTAGTATNGLFGAKPASSTPGLFGQQQSTQPQQGGLFGAKPAAPSGGLFGNNSTSNSGTSGGLFGNNNNTASTGLFGAKPAGTTGGLFGNTNTSSTLNNSTTSNGLFGNNNNTQSGGLFGSKPAGTTTGTGLGGSGGLFGNNNNTQSGGMFGNSLNQQQQNQQVQQQGPNVAAEISSLKAYGSSLGEIFSNIAMPNSLTQQGQLSNGTVIPPIVTKSVLKETSSSAGVGLSIGCVIPKPLFSNNLLESLNKPSESESSKAVEYEKENIIEDLTKKYHIEKTPELESNENKNAINTSLFSPKKVVPVVAKKNTIINIPEAAEEENKKTSEIKETPVIQEVIEPEEEVIKEDVNSTTYDGDFYIEPSLNYLKSLSLLEQRKVSNLKIGHKKYGSIEFLEPVDMSNLPLSEAIFKDNVIQFNKAEIQLNHDNLINKKCRIIKYNMWPIDKVNRRPITDPNHPIIKSHVINLKKKLDNIEVAKFESYDNKNGWLIFQMC